MEEKHLHYESPMIHRFRVRNFKSLLDVSVELAPITVLVGRSGTGKTNFVHALRLLRDVLAPTQQTGIPRSWPQNRPLTNPEGPTEFEVEFSIPAVEDRFSYRLAIAQEGPQYPPVEEQLDLGGKCLFHQAGGQNRTKWIVEPAVFPVPDTGPIALGRLPSVPEAVIAFTALTTGIGCYAFSDAVLRGTKTNRTVPGLDDDAANFLDVLKDIVSNLQDLTVRKSIVSSLRRVNPSISSAELDDIQKPSKVVIGHKFNGKTIAMLLDQESDGFRRFYAQLLALYQRPSKLTLVFEHPEDGIHPGALSVLADEFKAAPEKGRGQVLLTTHSPQLLDHFDPDQIRVVELDGFATRIGPLAEEQREALRDNLLNAGELLTVDPARLQAEAAGS